MTKFSIEAGLKFFDAGQPFVVIDRDGEFVTVENTLNHSRKVVKSDELEVRFLDGRCTAILKHDELPAKDTLPTDMLNEVERCEFRRRCAYIRKFNSLPAWQRSKDHLQHAIKELASKLNDPSPPSCRTLYRWLRAWRLGGENNAALIPKVRNRGPRAQHMRRDVRKLVLDVLRSKFLVRECPTLISVMPHLEEAMANYNSELDEQDRVAVPSYPTIHRVLKSMDPYEVMLKRHGKYAADQFFRNIGSGAKADFPLDLVQIDHTILDIQVLSPLRNLVARPTLTVALDVSSRLPIGIYIGFAAPGYETVMLCLRNAILPKDQLLAKMPEVKGNWPCYGLPRTILLDNGMEFHSEHLKDACNMLGIGIVYHPVRAPHYKGAVERFFRSVNTGFLSMLKGRTFSNVLEKGDYDPVKEAAVPFETFEALLYKWIVDVYARRFHRGIDDYPIEAWDAGCKKMPVELPQDTQDVLVLLCEVTHRNLSKQGVQVDNVHYNSEELNAYFRQLGKTTKVKLKTDPLDVGFVYVFNQQDQRFIKVPALKTEFHGVSKWQYKVLRRLVTVRRNQGDQTYGVAEALREIGRHIENLSSKNGKKKCHKRAVRFAGYENTTQQNMPAKPGKQELEMGRSLNFDLDSMDVSELLDAAAAAGWRNLNSGEAG